MKKRLRGISPPDDVLLIKVLPLLPTVSLCKFKCVCKNWQRMISEDVFYIRNYSSPATICYPSNYSSPATICYPSLLVLSNGKAEKVSISSLLPLRPPIVSTNGLLCYPDPQSTSFCISNPATQQRAIIPNPKQRKRHMIGLAFDPSNPTQRFDLVCPYINRMQGREYMFEVFSSDTGVWRASKAKVKLIDNSEFVSHVGRVFAGGILYWRCSYGMMWFDLGKDVAGTVKWPTSVSWCVQIGEFDDWLTLIQITAHKTIEIWIMREFRWHKMHCFTAEMVFGPANFKTIAPYCRVMELRSRKPWDNLCCPCRLLPVPFGGGNVIYFRKKDEIFSYDMRTGQLTHVYTTHPPSWLLYKKTIIPLPQVKTSM